jgi:hypothetical protein
MAVQAVRNSAPVANAFTVKPPAARSIAVESRTASSSSMTTTVSRTISKALR